MKEKNKYLQLEWSRPIETIKTKILSINRVRIIFQLISLEKTMIRTLESIIFLNSDCKKATKKRWKKIYYLNLKIRKITFTSNLVVNFIGKIMSDKKTKPSKYWKKSRILYSTRKITSKWQWGSMNLNDEFIN